MSAPHHFMYRVIDHKPGSRRRCFHLRGIVEAGLETLVVGYESPDEDTCARRLEGFAQLAWG